MHHDLLATGGTAAAKIELVERLGGEVVGVAQIAGLSGLEGRKKLGGTTSTAPEYLQTRESAGGSFDGPPPPDQGARHPTPIVSGDYADAVVLTVN